MLKTIVINILFIAGIVLGFLFIDRYLATFFHNHIPSGTIYNFGTFIGSFTSSVQFRVIALISGLIGAWKFFGNNSESARNYLFIFLSFFISYFIAFALKFTLARYRPELLFSNNLFGFHFFATAHSYTSFPSGHTVSAFSIAFALGYILKSRRIVFIIFILALIIGSCRIIIYAHFFTDVLTSIYLSYIIVSLLYLKYRKKLDVSME